MPEGPNGKKLPGIKHLLVIPNQFELQPIEKSEPTKLLLRLIRNKEVETIGNAAMPAAKGN